MQGLASTIAAVMAAMAIAGCSPTPEPPAREPAEAANPSGAATGAEAATASEAATRSDDDSAAAADPSALTAQGWGPLRIGMTRAEVVAAAGEDANPEAVGGPEPDVCDQFRPADAPEGLLVMIEGDRLTRISVARTSDITTDRGFGVGSDGDEIAAAYGDAATRSPHKYLAGRAEYITIWSTDLSAEEARGIVYETGTDGRVTHMHAGGRSIRYVEGCL